MVIIEIMPNHGSDIRLTAKKTLAEMIPPASFGYVVLLLTKDA